MTIGATHFRELEVWQVAMALAKAVYKVARTFPAEEKFGLATQTQRAAVSIPSNIAEGNARHSSRDYARFIGMASGSAAELQTQLILAKDLELADETKVAEVLELCERVSKMLYRLRESLMRRAQGRSRIPGPGSRVPGPE